MPPSTEFGWTACDEPTLFGVALTGMIGFLLITADNGPACGRPPPRARLMAYRKGAGVMARIFSWSALAMEMPLASDRERAA